MHDELDRITRRTRAYWFVDGLVELALGCQLGLGALTVLIGRSIPNVWPLASLLRDPATVMILSSLPVIFIVRALKARITYPRTGYASFDSVGGVMGCRWLVTVMLALLIVSVTVFILSISGQLLRSAFPLPLGGILAGGFALIGFGIRLRRFYLLAGWSLLAGVAAAVSGFDFELGTAMYYGLMSLALIVSGALTLRVYLRNAPQPAAEEDAA